MTGLLDAAGEPIAPEPPKEIKDGIELLTVRLIPADKEEDEDAKDGIMIIMPQESPVSALSLLHIIQGVAEGLMERAQQEVDAQVIKPASPEDLARIKG